MAVLMTAEVSGQTKEGYEGMLAVLTPLLQQANGFISHGAGPAGDEWRAFEVWETQEQATEFFAKYIHPNMPPGVKARRTFLELHSLIQK